MLVFLLVHTLQVVVVEQVELVLMAAAALVAQEELVHRILEQVLYLVS